jgi:hypothetical protein
MAKGESTIEERAENLHNVSRRRTSEAQVERVTSFGRAPELAERRAAVAQTMKTALGPNPMFRMVDRNGLDFLLSMGLLVQDPSERARALMLSLPFAVTWRK